MKALILIAIAALIGFAPGCAREKKPSWRIIEEGKPNPYIRYAPERAGERVRRD